MTCAMVGELCAETVARGSHEDVLARITEPDVHLAMWDRLRPAELAWIDDLSWDEIDDIDRMIDAAAVSPCIASTLEDAGYPTGVEGEALHGEIASLVRRFAEIMGCDRMRWRLEVVETDACRKFHADMVSARLLMSLSGSTTQWVHVDMPDDVRDMRLGAAGLFKGRLWAENPRILHRSPPIAGTGRTRLLLVINPAAVADVPEIAG